MANLDLRGMDLDGLSLEDLRALRSGDYDAVSRQGLYHLKRERDRPRQEAENAANAARRQEEALGTGMDRFFAGGRSELANAGLGIRQMAANVGFGDRAALEREAALKRETDAPLLATGAGRAGQIAGMVLPSIAAAAAAPFVAAAAPVAGAALAGAGLVRALPLALRVAQGATRAGQAVNTVRGGAAVGAASGALAPTVEGESRAVNTGLGAVAGAAGTAVAAKLGRMLGTVKPSPFGDVGPDPSAGLTRAQQSALEAGERLGMKATPGQRTGSKALRQMEAKLESQPITSGAFNSVRDTNQKVANRAAAASIGENADEVGTAQLGAAKDRIQQTYERVGNDRVRNLDDRKLELATRELADEYEGVTLRAVEDHPLVNQFADAVRNGTATGRVLQGISSKLNRAAKGEIQSASGDRELGRALFDFKEIVDDALESGLDDAERAAFSAARSQYRNLKLFEQAGVLNPSNGNVSARSLANALDRLDKNAFRYGQGPRAQAALMDVARFAKAFPELPDSGTATRMPFEGGSLGLALNLGTKLAAPLYTSKASGLAAVGGAKAGRAAGSAGRSALTEALSRYPGAAAPAAAGLSVEELGRIPPEQLMEFLSYQPEFSAALAARLRDRSRAGTGPTVSLDELNALFTRN